jgi:hypothetical protein
MSKILQLFIRWNDEWKQQGVSYKERRSRLEDAVLMVKIIREMRQEKQEERLKQGNKVLKFGEFCKEWKQDKQYVPWKPLIKVPTMEPLPYVSIRQAVDETLYRLKTNSDLAEYRLAA